MKLGKAVEAKKLYTIENLNTFNDTKKLTLMGELNASDLNLTNSNGLNFASLNVLDISDATTAVTVKDELKVPDNAA